MGKERFGNLFSPYTIRGVEIKNRLVVPAMGTNLGNADGSVSQRLIDYYQARAKGGFGLIVVEGVAVNSTGMCIPNEGHFWDDSSVTGMQKLVSAIHQNGAKTILQIHHAGRQTHPGNIGGQQPIAPSRIACPVDNTLPREIPTEEVYQIIEDFGNAALRAKKAGFDGVDIHGAHGYFVAQFMSGHANKRIDEFGGTFEGRMKFPLEIVKNVRGKCGDDFIIGFRLSYDEKIPGGRTLEESLVVSHLLEEAGVDLLDISIMTYASTEYMSANGAMPNGYNQFATEKIKGGVNIPVIAVGRITPAMAEDMVRTDKADFIAIGRGSLADPELPNKLADGRMDEISPCISCTQSCLGYILSDKLYASCLVNPVTGHEGEYDFTPVSNVKRVLVVGGGPAGLMAAKSAAQRGHKVILCEKSDTLGGQFRLAAVPPTKHDIAGAIRYYVTMCKKYGVELRLNTPVDEAVLKEIAPDAVVWATGSVPAYPPIEGIHNEKFLTVADVLDGKALPGPKVLIAGGGMSGVETADFLSEHFRACTVIEMRPDIALDEEYTPRVFLMKRLAEKNVASITSAKITKFYDDGIDYEQNGETHSARGFDNVILAMGMKAYNPLEEIAKQYAGEVYVVGDAKLAGPANKATEGGLGRRSENLRQTIY